MIHLPPSVQPLEIVWTLVGLCGAYFSVPFCWRFRKKYREYQRLKTGQAERVLVRMYLVVGVLMVESHLVIVIMGAAAMTIVPPVANTVTPTTLVITLGIICLGATAVAVSYWMDHSHTQLNTLFHAHEGGIP